MKKLILLCLMSIFGLTVQMACAETLQGGVSLNDRLPTNLYGSWKVRGLQIYSNTNFFSAPSIDYWNIYRNNDVITLENPQTNAIASVTVNSVNNNTVTFTRKSETPEKKTVETPTITIAGENFWGIDKIVTKKYKDGKHVKTEVLVFSIEGIKTGGNSASELLDKNKTIESEI